MTVLSDYCDVLDDVVQEWIDYIDGLIDLQNSRVADAIYLPHLAKLLNLEPPTSFDPTDATSVSTFRSTIDWIIDWYKMKGTYQSIQVIALILGYTINVKDMYTKDYNTFVPEDWFSGKEEGENPPDLDSTYYKSPHFGIWINLDKIYGDSSFIYTKALNHFEGANLLETNSDDVKGPLTLSSYYKSVVSPKFGSGSGSFNGTSILITSYDNKKLNFEANNFTIDFWEYHSNAHITEDKCFFSQASSDDISKNPVKLNIATGTYKLKLYMYDNTGALIINDATSTSAVPQNQWNHIAVVRNGSGTGNIVVYVNGVAEITQDFPGTIYDSNGLFTIGAVYVSNTSKSSIFRGNIDEFRVSYGVARWTTAFPSDLPTEYSRDKDTVLLYHWNGPHIDTSTSYFGESSLYFDGNSYAQYAITHNTDFSFLDDDFTIEVPIRFQDFGSISAQVITYLGIMGVHQSWRIGVVPNIVSGIVQGYRFIFQSYGRDTSISTSTATWYTLYGKITEYATDVWYHFAVVRNGTSIKIYVDGIDITDMTGGKTVYESSFEFNAPGSNPLYLGVWHPSSSARFTGWLDEVRVSKGIALGSTTFPVPTEAYDYEHLWRESYVLPVKEYIEKTRPAHTVPHYVLYLNPQTDKYGTMMTVDPYVRTKFIGTWTEDTLYFDPPITSTWNFDNAGTAKNFDTVGATYPLTINKWVLGTGNKGQIPGTVTTMETPSATLTGTISDITYTAEYWKYKFTVAKSAVQDGISELGLYVGSTLVVLSTFPDIDKSDDVEIVFEVLIYRNR